MGSPERIRAEGSHLDRQGHRCPEAPESGVSQRPIPDRSVPRQARSIGRGAAPVHAHWRPVRDQQGLRIHDPSQRLQGAVGDDCGRQQGHRSSRPPDGRSEPDEPSHCRRPSSDARRRAVIRYLHWVHHCGGCSDLWVGQGDSFRDFDWCRVRAPLHSHFASHGGCGRGHGRFGFDYESEFEADSS